MDPEKRRLNEYIKARHFEGMACWHINWECKSRTLKHAADRLYKFYIEASDRSFKRISEKLHNGSLEGSRPLEGQELVDFWDEQLISVYFLLMGYSLENLLKSILMIQHPEYFKPDLKLVDIRSHDLVGLCRRCKIKLEPKEVDLLKALTVFIEWKGKYPIPLLSDDMWKEMNPDGTLMPSGASKHLQQQEIESLYIKFFHELQRIKPAQFTYKTPEPL